MNKTVTQSNIFVVGLAAFFILFGLFDIFNLSKGRVFRFGRGVNRFFSLKEADRIEIATVIIRMIFFLVFGIFLLILNFNLY